MRPQSDDAVGVDSYGRAMELRTDTKVIPPPSRGAQGTWPPSAPVRWQPARSNWTAWTLVTVASIWTAVVLISVFSPDMIHGSEQQRMPVAAFGTWLWGFVASVAVFVAMARLRGDSDRRLLWMMLFGATVVIWSAATLVSVFGPTNVTGSDPTTIPIAALIAPIVAMVATIVTGTIVLVAHALSHMQQEVR
jgi:hypothetical protein